MEEHNQPEETPCRIHFEHPRKGKPGGGWLSSAPDMARFEVAILADRLVKRATRDLMWTEQMPTDGLGRMAYGLGWEFGATEGVKDVGHGGSQQGTSAGILIAPDGRAGVVVLTNSDSANGPGLASEILRIVLGVPEHKHNEVAVNPSLLDSYLGTYRMGDFSVAIVREGDRLLFQVRDQKFSLSPESDRDFFVAGLENVHVLFMANGNGQATELILRESGTDSYLNRIK